MLSILVPSSAKRTATQILVIAILNVGEDLVLGDFVYHDMIFLSKQLPVQS